MPILRCKMCGGTMEIDAKQSVAVCQYCGTRQTLPRLDSERVAGLYERAELLRRGNDFDKAATVYEQIVSLAPNDAEAYWSLVLCRYGIEYVEDPASHKRVPTINRVQFGSILEDADYLSALQNADDEQKSVYIAEAKAIEAIQKGYLAISEREKPFDVFICYKETDDNGRRTMDSVLANDIYHQLTQEGFKVFFSRITLEDKLGTEYEPYIFAALNSAKVMVVLGTKPEYFSAVWVRNEWSRFLALIKNGEQKVLIPAYRDMSPYDLPEEFSHLQALDMSRLGFMQDLIRGIKKILGAENAAGTANAATSPLLRRAFLFLEDRDWRSAAEYSEKILDQEPENARAYLCKLMAELQVSKPEDLRKHRAALQKNRTYRRAVQYADSALKAELQSYVAEPNEKIVPTKAGTAQQPTANNRKQRIAILAGAAVVLAAVAVVIVSGSIKQDNAYKSAQTLLSSGEYEKAAEAFSALDGYKDSETQRAEAEAALAAQKNVEAYASAQELLKTGKFDEAITAFETLGDYSDSAAQVTAAKQKKQEAEQEAENRSAYEAAETLLANEEYDAAIDAFTALGNYADAADRVVEVEDAKQSAEEEAANKEAYAAAVNLFEEKKYTVAKAAFEELGEYSDAKAKVEECQKQLDAQVAATAPSTEKSAANNSKSNAQNSSSSVKTSGPATTSKYEYNADGTIAKETRYLESGFIQGWYIYSYSGGQLVKKTWYNHYGEKQSDEIYENGKLVRDELVNGVTVHYDSNGKFIYYSEIINGERKYYTVTVNDDLTTTKVYVNP